MRSLCSVVLMAVVIAYMPGQVDAATTAQIDAARDKGLAWLVTHQRANGSWRSVAGTEAVATATAVEAFGVAGVKTEPYAAAVAWLSNATVVSLDSLARQIIALAGAGLDMTTATQTLVKGRNASRAWGAYPSFETTYPDTALALAAIRVANYGYSDTDLMAALCRIVVAQKPQTEPAAVAGGWSWTYADANGPANAPATVGTAAILPTVYNLLEIDAIRVARSWASAPNCPGAQYSTPYDLATVVTNGLNWLTTQRWNAGDGGFGDGGASSVLETALAYHALATLRPGDSTVGPALDYLVSVDRQRPSGSWNGDAFVTALVLKVIPLGTPYADVDVDGLPDRVETELGTNPYVADSRWIAPKNALTALPAPTAANDFGIILTALGPSDGMRAQPQRGFDTGPTTGNRRGLGSGAGDTDLPDPLALTVSTEAFQVDLYTGGAIAELPTAVPPGAGGVVPSIVLRYDSVSVDALTASEPGPGTGLGWTLVTGPVIVRDHKATTVTSDDTFTLVMGGKRHELVLVDAAQGVYHTRDEIFLKLQYTSGADSWALTTKDGTRWELGATAGSKQSTLVASPWTTSVTYRYYPSATTSTSGVTITYAYSKDTATVSGQVYDQSIYLDTITWASVGGAVVGTPRQVTFVRSARSDWPLSPSAPMHVDKKQLDAIEVRVGTALVRTYVLTYDYSIDRAPGTTWSGGGATGDLALRTLTLYGTDQATALPAASFAYDGTSGRLTSAANGLGGQVTYTYTVPSTETLYSVCSTSSCADWGGCTEPNPAGYPASAVLGYLLSTAQADTVAIYSGCKETGAYGGCADWGVTSGTGYALLGYAFSPALPQVLGTLGLYSVNQGGWKAVTATTAPTGGTLLGYVYPVDVGRYGRVDSRVVSDGRTADATTTYTYSTLALEANGAIRGYASAQATDPGGTYVNTYFTQGDDANGRIYQADTYAGTALLRRTENTWTVATPYPATAPTVTLATLTQSDVTSYDGGVAITTRRTWQYDGYANPTVARSEGDLAVTGDEREERTDWIVDPASWIHRPSRVALHDGAGAVVRERWLSYDTLAWGVLGSRGVLTREERRLAGAMGTAGNAVTATGYDAYGNVTTTTDPIGCTTTTAYTEPTSALPDSVTTCLNHVTRYGYDAYGRRTSVTDPNNQMTTYAFDPVGRLTKITGPLDALGPDGSVTYQYPAWGNPATQAVRALRPKLHGQAATLGTDSYFDGRGRVYAWQSSGPAAGQVMAQAREFDPRGWISQRSAPYLVGSETAVWTAYQYDPLGRVTQVTYPDATLVTVVYGAVAGVGALETVTDERGSARRLYSDAYSRVVTVEEVDGATTGVTRYAYDAAGSLTRITAATGSVTSFVPDDLGRQTGMTDPNLGTWSWGYDAAGNLTSRTDARHQTLTFEYDLQSRLRFKRYQGNALTEWQYDTPGVSFSKGRLTAVLEYALGLSTAFYYDSLGRVFLTTRNYSGAHLDNMFFKYDAGGRVESQAFPDGESIAYSYNDAGWLERIPGYVEAPGGGAGILYNARGQRTQITFANGTTTLLTYHPTNFRLTELVTTAPGGTLQNFSYRYDGTGNLTQVTDSVGTAGRTFAYDALNRLVRASGWFDGVTEDYAYDRAGNLLRRASLLYAYSDPAHVWATTYVTDGRAYSYDANGAAETAAGIGLVWNLDGRVQTVTRAGETASYEYDAQGLRVRKTTAAGVTRSPFPGYEVDPSGVVQKSLGFVVKRGNRVTYYHDDHLGSTNVLTDTDGVEVQRVEYTPWGQISRWEGGGDPGWRFRTADGAAGERGRLYDPALGRLLVTDRGPSDLADPQTLNPYAYARNNPASPVVRRPGDAGSAPCCGSRSWISPEAPR